MIHISCKPGTPPASLTNKTAKNQIDKAFNTQDGEKCTNYTKVYDKLKAISLHKKKANAKESGKCFYCESKIEHGSKLQIEHYRPKAGVSKKDTGGVENEGYFWLANEWTNLLLACDACNGNGAKGTRFPIAGTRAIPYNPVKNNKLYRKNCIASNATLLAEIPILLNPEMDNPENHLTFDFDGQIKELPDLYNRGKITIEILELDRGTLFGARQRVLNDFKNELDMIYETDREFGINKPILDKFLKARCRKIKKRMEPQEEFSLWGKFINVNFVDCFANQYSEPFRSKLIEAYKDA